MWRYFKLFLPLLVLAQAGLAHAEPVRVVTSIETLADLARAVGGGNVKVLSLARGYQDPHFVEAKPSLLVPLSQADLLSIYRRVVAATRGLEARDRTHEGARGGLIGHRAHGFDRRLPRDKFLLSVGCEVDEAAHDRALLLPAAGHLAAMHSDLGRALHHLAQGLLHLG